MYDLGPVLPESAVAPGTNLLIAGPAMVGKSEVAHRILAHGTQAGEGAIIVTTTDGAERTLDTYGDHVGSPDDLPVGVVDCVTRQRGEEADDTATVKYAASPEDMTGIGIHLSELLEEFYSRRGLTENRILLNSISTLLMYSDLQTVFRFLHVFTGRVASADALGLYVIDSTTHDEQELNTLKQLFDGVLTVESADGEPGVSTTGI